MNRSGTLGMALHQSLSFASPMMALSRREAVFWPGCALMGLDPAILLKTAEVLRREEPELGLSACCCGQPSRYLLEKSFPARRDRLAALLERRGVRRVYAACPNCARELEGLVEVRLIWSVLARCIRREDISGSAAAVTIHDPCPLRNQPEELAAARVLLELAGAAVTEPAHSGQKTVCCGNIQMLRTRDPEKSRALRIARIGEFPQGQPVASCCEGCLDAFRGEGLDTVHLLEVLFGRSGARGWGNRLSFTRLAQKTQKEAGYD